MEPVWMYLCLEPIYFRLGLIRPRLVQSKLEQAWQLLVSFICVDIHPCNVQYNSYLCSPDVSGIAAAILHAHPSWTPAQVRDSIVNTAYLLPSGDYLATLDGVNCQETTNPTRKPTNPSSWPIQNPTGPPSNPSNRPIQNPITHTPTKPAHNPTDRPIQNLNTRSPTNSKSSKKIYRRRPSPW